MKPLYLLLIFYALFITGFGDMLELICTVIFPGIGIAIGMPLDMVINITMGSGLVFLLAQNGMFHPKFGPAGIVASILPGIDTLPIWLALVITAILQQIAKEKRGVIGLAAKVATSATSVSSSPIGAVKAARTMTQAVQNRPQAVSQNTEAAQRVPLNLKSPRMSDIKPYVQKAA